MNTFSGPLGYATGKPPQDYEERLVSYAKQRPGGALTLEAREFLSRLTRKGHAPGWSKEEIGWMSLGLPETSDPDSYPASRTFHGQKNRNTSLYHYIVVRESKEAPWKLQRAWRTAPDGRVVEEYSVR
jgi:hypothetical protein